jgi:hypothetical protein
MSQSNKPWKGARTARPGNGFFRPFRASPPSDAGSQGVALGYRISPLQVEETPQERSWTPFAPRRSARPRPLAVGRCPTHSPHHGASLPCPSETHGPMGIPSSVLCPQKLGRVPSVPRVKESSRCLGQLDHRCCRSQSSTPASP